MDATGRSRALAKRLGARVAQEKARRVAAAVQTDIERVQPGHAAREQLGGAAAAQVILATTQQFRANAAPAMGRDDADEAKNTLVVTQSGAVGVGTESSVREADGLFTVQGED